MIDLNKHYGDLEAEKLVEILESNKAYKKEVIDFCKERLLEMNISNEQLKIYSKKVLRNRFYKYFTDGKYRTNEVIEIDSFFLNIKETKACFKLSKEEYIKYLDGATRDLPA
ncbi:hypothetical protein SCB49_14780 [unidentified eubacterium SCB49]|nr:hypothetical protein SCB49_14780 [unidentified eubacterium SCB49]